MPDGSEDHADQAWDSYQERVLRNEGRLEGLENLVRETRAADKELIAQRSDSLAQQLQEQAETLAKLHNEERIADQTEYRSALQAIKDFEEAIFAKNDRRLSETMTLMRAMTEKALEANQDRSDAKNTANRDRMNRLHEMLSQQLLQWRDTDKEARDLLNRQNEQHFERLNHAHERQQEFQANSVTRELWQAGEKNNNDKIAALERAMLGMTPTTSFDAANASMQVRIEDMSIRLQKESQERMIVLTDKINDLKESQASAEGRSSGYSALYGWAIAGFTLLIGVIVAANAVLGK